MGEALHVLPGMGHSCRALHQGSVACHSRPPATAAIPSDHPTLSPADHDYQISCDNCPICQFFSQTKCFLIVGDFGCESTPVYTQVTFPPLIFLQPCLSVYQSRGPPADLWIS
jgi:hypothetical protein